MVVVLRRHVGKLPASPPAPHALTDSTLILLPEHAQVGVHIFNCSLASFSKIINLSLQRGPVYGSNEIVSAK